MRVFMRKVIDPENFPGFAQHLVEDVEWQWEPRMGQQSSVKLCIKVVAHI